MINELLLQGIVEKLKSLNIEILVVLIKLKIFSLKAF
jgi:hypothetical protein